jgi:hypothetical protein
MGSRTGFGNQRVLAAVKDKNHRYKHNTVNIQFVRRLKHCNSVTKTSILMPPFTGSLNTKNTLCARNVELLVINLLKTKRVCFIQGLSSYRAVNTLHFGYKNQSLNVL